VKITAWASQLLTACPEYAGSRERSTVHYVVGFESVGQGSSDSEQVEPCDQRGESIQGLVWFGEGKKNSGDAIHVFGWNSVEFGPR